MFVSCTCLTGDRLKALLRQLPACNYTLVAYIFRHAQDIVRMVLFLYHKCGRLDYLGAFE
jgi:hypothetical protein